MKVLFTTAVFAVAAIGGAVGQFRRSFDRQGGCSTALDALNAYIDVIYGCGMPDMVSFKQPATG